MDPWTVIFRIDLILAMIVLTFYAFRELQGFWHEHVEHRAEMAKHRFDAAVDAAVSKVTGTTDAALDGVADVVDVARSKLADGLEDTADAVRPDEQSS